MKTVVFWLALAAALAPALARAEEAAPAPAPQGRELIYCADLMTHAERTAYRAQMRAARTPEEKAAIRDAHRQEMRRRALARGSDQLCEPRQRRWRGGRGQ